jgi:hypothetical protein
MKTAEQKVSEKFEKATATLKVARKQSRMARRLLTLALDVIPDYIDGRNDRLCDAIGKWLETPDA